MPLITLQFDSYDDMTSFCKQVARSTMPTQKNYGIDYSQLEALSNNINTFCDEVEADLDEALETEYPTPELTHLGRSQKAIIRMFCNYKIFDYEMVKFRMPKKTESGNYIEYRQVLDRMVRKNMLILLDNKKYFVNPALKDLKPDWLDIYIED